MRGTTGKPAGRILAEAGRRDEALLALAAYLTDNTRSIQAGMRGDADFNGLREKFGIRGYVSAEEGLDQIKRYLAFP